MAKLLRTQLLPSVSGITKPSTKKWAEALTAFLDDAFARTYDSIYLPSAVITKTAACALTAENIVLCNGTFTVTLPPVSSSLNKIFSIKNIGTGTITVDGYAAETIDGVATKALAQNEYITIVCDRTEWWII